LTTASRAVYAAAVITLHQPPPAWGIPSLSPFCAKVETYLRMVDLPYRTRPGDPRKQPKGKVPWIEEDGRTITDSSDIIDYLKARHGDPLDRDLDHAQRALAHLARRTIEEHLYWVLVYTRWVEPAGFVHNRDYFRKLLPRVIGDLLIHQVIRKRIVGSLHAHGLGRHERADIYRRGREDLDALAALLDERPYFLGEQPTSIDASLYALTGGLAMHPADNPIKQHLAALPNLAAYTERMHNRYFGERPPGGTVD
jgi:glutathione S-transferase